MRAAGDKVPTYTVQAAVDAEHALIITQAVTDHAAAARAKR